MHVGALEELYTVFDTTCGEDDFSVFLDKSFELLMRPDGAPDGILSKDLAISIGKKLKRDTDRKDGIAGASVEIIDSFTVPSWRPQALATASVGSSGRRITAPSAPIIDASSSAKGDMFRTRYELILSKTLRNPQFRPPASGMLSIAKKSPYFQLTGIESLSGSKGEKLVLGMLTQLEEGVWFLEDLNGTVRLDLSQASVTAGLHTECSFVIAQGLYIEDEGEAPLFQVSAMGTPPLETREDSIIALGRNANLFGGQYDLGESSELSKLEEEAVDNIILFMSDVALDNSRVMAGLRHVFRGYLQDEIVPTVIVLMGSFLSHPFGQQVDDVNTLCSKFGELGDMIVNEFKPLAEESTFVIIPSVSDPGPGNVLPRPPMPKMITRQFVQAVGAERVRLATNPCRMRYMTQEIVLLRDDIMQKMVRHCSIKPDFGESGLMSEHLVKSIVDQSYLCPLPQAARPVLWNHGHSLWLFPNPHVLVLADKVDSYICKYGGGLSLNPGSFTTDFSFQVYLPAEKRAQQCSLDSEDVEAANKPDNNEDSDDASVEDEEVDEHLRPVSPPPSASDGDALMLDEPVQKGFRETSYINEIQTGAVEDGSQNKNENHKDMSDVEQANGGDDDLDSEQNVLKSENDGDSDNRGSEDESDDDSMLIPAEGIKKFDIKAHVKKSTMEDESRENEEDDE